VLADLLPLLASDPREKAVLFSQSANVVAHFAAALRARGVGAVRILPHMPEPERAAAVRQFNDCADVRVFLLHVGAAAAGLTLTAASTMLLLEPMLLAADEAQAINRCHRIGQTKPCRTLAYYVTDSVEERLLAYRARERANPALPAAAAAADAAAEAAAAEAAQAGKEEEGTGLSCLSSKSMVADGAKLRFLFGLAPDED
jgi:E3 ubiquitin-protein ligase SHPRH